MNLCRHMLQTPVCRGAPSLLLPCSGPGPQSSVSAEMKGKGLCLAQVAHEASSEACTRVLKHHGSIECLFGVVWPQQEYFPLGAIDSLWVFLLLSSLMKFSGRGM